MRHSYLKVLAFLMLYYSQVFSQTCNYTYARLIRIDHTKVSGGSNLSNFPVLISTLGLTDQNLFKSVANSGHVQSNNGYDIIFTAQDGTTLLSFEMENYVPTTGEYEAWVNVPTVYTAVDTYIYMYYGNSAVTTNQSSTAAWNSNFVGVWHLNNAITDATSNGNNGTNSGTTNNSSGQIAAGRSIGGGSNYLQVGLSGASSGSGNGSVELWGKITTYGNSTYFFGESSTQDGTYNNRIQLYQGDAAGNLYLGLGNNHSLKTNIQTLSTNTWYHIALTWATTGAGVGNYTVYVNGVSKATGTYAGFSAVYTAADLGNDGNAGQRTEAMTGLVDEARVSNTTRNAGWITTSYNSQNSPSTFAIISIEPNMWTGSTNSNWNNNGNWSSGSAPAAGDNVIIANVANQPNFNNGNAVGFIYLKTGATLTIPSSKTFTVTNDFINCGTLNNSGALTMGSTSSTNQYITGSGTYNMADLTINNTATTPTVTLNVPISMSGVLTLTSGLLNTTSTNLLTLQNGATAPALTAASTSYVNGPMAYQKSTSGSTTLNFPIGKSPDCRPVILTANHSTTTLYNYTGECFNANPWTTFGSTTTDMPTNTIDTISGVHYVTIARTDGSGTSQPSAGLSGNQTIQMFFGTNDFVYQGSKLSIVKNTSATPATWIDIGGTSALGSFSTPQAGSVTSTSAPSAFTSFSSFALGSRRTGWNSLPIDLLSFTATPNKTFVELKWVSQTETNNRSYTIERSNDGVTFSDLKTVPSKAPGGNSLQALSYSEKDHKPLPGTSYYRLKQTDINGASKTYNIVSVNISSNGQVVFTVYPNPNQGEFNVDFSGLENNHEVEVYMHDMLGKEVYHNIFTAQEQMGSFSIVPEQKISAGPYLVSLYLEGIKYQVKVLVN